MKPITTQPLLALLALLVVLTFFAGSSAAAADPVVRAVLFYSPFCSHCHEVMENDLPPLEQAYGRQLQILKIDVSQEPGTSFYQQAVAELKIPDERLGVPALVLGNLVLVGSDEIPARLPGEIEALLAAGGQAWPIITGLQAFLPDGETVAPAQPAQQTPGDWRTRFMNDPTGNTIAVVVLVVMLLTILAVGYAYVMDAPLLSQRWPEWIIPALAVIGLGVALYLSYVEISQADAICGPVGDCNAVQRSPYAKIFGLIPVGLFGAAGYIALLAAWFGRRYGSSSVQKPLAIAAWAMAWFGLLFSIYLTFMEPFVIGATCMWCITSALVMTLIFWASAPPALEALRPAD